MPPRARMEFRQALVKEFSSIAKAMCRIDAETAEAFSAEDQKRIKDTIEDRVGVTVVNKMIHSRMREWLAETGSHALRSEVALHGEKKVACGGLINNLALLLKVQGKLTEAEPLYRRALKGIEEVLGPKHPDTLTSVNNLALLLKAQYKLTEAEPLYRRALKGREEVLGPKHHLTFQSVNNLGTLLRAQGKLTEAEPLYRRALKGSEEWPGVMKNLSKSPYKTCIHIGDMMNTDAQFKAVTGADDATAKFYLQKAKGDPTVAVNLYFNAGAKPVKSEHEEEIRLASEKLEALEKELKEETAVLKTSISKQSEAPKKKEDEKKTDPMFWDPSHVDPSTRPEYYKVNRDQAKKEKSPNLIYNLCGGPARTDGVLSFGLQILASTPLKYEYNSLGLNDTVNGHLRATNGGLCVCVDTGALYHCGGLVSGQTFPRGLCKGDTLFVQYDFKSNVATFKLQDQTARPVGKPIACEWTKRNGPARPAIALRDVGWMIRLVSGDGSDIEIPIEILVKRWTKTSDGLLDVTKGVLAEAMTTHAKVEAAKKDSGAKIKEAVARCEALVKAVRPILDDASAATGGVLGDKLRSMLEKVRPLLTEMQTEAKKIDEAVKKTKGKKVRAVIYNVDTWFNPQNGIMGDVESVGKEAERVLAEVTSDPLFKKARAMVESGEDDDGGDGAATKTSSTEPVRAGAKVLLDLERELREAASKVQEIAKRCRPILEKIKKETPQPEHLTYTAPASAGAIDWAKITEWIELAKGSYDPDATDPITMEEFGSGPVVELSCSTPKIKCVMLKSTALQTLATTGVCPICKMRYPTFGQQPTGTMNITPNFQQHCAGNEGDGCYVINYSFGNGTQTDRNLRPGQRYNGTTRTCYVPMTTEGAEAIELLKSAFKQGHLFRVGDSVTTGSKNQTVWAGIHQKTTTSGGQTNHGWPDPGYFGRLRNECAASGVFSEEFLAAAARDRKKWKLARQLSDEKKKDKKSGGHGTPKKAPKKTPKTGPKDPVRIAAIDKRVAEINTELRAAMAKNDRKSIVKLMQERAKLSAEKASLA
eukprot:g2351.t1